MYRVLIADDEAIIREGLKTFPWEKYGCRVIGEADNGEAAWQLAQSLQPDIVFTDIRMPGMDGLALAQEIGEAYPAMAVVLLSGYDDFQYAQKALQLGIRDYILKPTEEAVVGEALLKLTESIRRHQAKQEMFRQMQQQMENALPLLRARLVGELINGSHLSEEEARSRLALYEVAGGNYVVVSVGGADRSPEAQGSDRELQLLALSIEEHCTTRFREAAGNAIGIVNRLRMHYLLLFDEASTDDGCRAAAVDACADIQQTMSRRLGVGLSFGISEPTRELSELHRAGVEANRALDHRFFVGDNAIILFSDLQEGAERHPSIGQIDYLHALVGAGDRDAIGSFFRELGSRLLAGQPGEIGQVQKTVIELVLRVAWAIGGTGADGHAGPGLSEFEFIQGAMDCPTQEQLLAYAEKTIGELVDRRREEAGARSAGIVSRIVRFIHDNHGSELSLDVLSEHFQLSSAYISRLLRNKTGKSFMEILVNDRMEHAKKLLRTGNYKVNQVSEMIGYQDLSYFIQTFKKRYGITPNEYKTLQLNVDNR